ncbi:MAG: SDR family oxidoreductase, partial [Anaerolineae bacterium]|nr:SDR family oxidoreductase [Anaerolineae bacterium]
TYLGQPDDMQAAQIAADIRAQGGLVATFPADLADPSIIPTIFDQAETTFGPVDILVNNAAYSVNDTIYTIDTRQIDRHYAVNVRAMLLACQEYARRHGGGMGGRIINVSSGVVEGAPEELAYSASKGAVETLTRGLAKALAPKQILVNAVSPGPTDTGWLTPTLRDELAARTPLRRIGQPEDIADVIVFLASEQARWLTGQIIDAGGGWHMRF